MRVLVTLFSYKDKASDGSLIPKEVIGEYLKSADYKNIIDSKISLGGITHKNRTLSEEDSQNVGPDDGVLLSGNFTHYIDEIFIKDDGFCWAWLTFLDEDLMNDETKARVKNIKGLLKKGVKMKLSAVVHAYWNTQEVALEIVTIKGCDWTLSPAFKGSQVQQIQFDEV